MEPGSERGGLLAESLHLLLAKFWRGSRAAAYRRADQHEKLLLSGRRAHAKQARGLRGVVPEEVRRVGGNIHGHSALDHGCLAAKGERDLAFKQREHFLEIV